MDIGDLPGRLRASPAAEAARHFGRLLRKSFLWAWLDVVCQYRRSRIGPFWETINVIVMTLGLTLVSSAVLGGEFAGHVGYVGLGVVVWSAISGLINEGSSIFVKYRALIVSTTIGVDVYVGRTVFNVMITFAHHLVIYVVGVMLMLIPIGWISLLAIPGIVLFFVNGVWVVTVLAFVCARFRDVELIVRNLLQLAFFVTPVFWNHHQIVGSRRFLVEYNVLFHFLEIIRGPLLGHLPPAGHYVVVAGVTVFGSALAVLVQRRMRRPLAFFV